MRLIRDAYCTGGGVIPRNEVPRNLPVGPVELGEAGGGAGVASFDERIAERERHAAFELGFELDQDGAGSFRE